MESEIGNSLLETSELCLFIVKTKSFEGNKGKGEQNRCAIVGTNHIKYQNTHHALLKVLKKQIPCDSAVDSVMKLGLRALPENSKGAAKTAHIENLSHTQTRWQMINPKAKLDWNQDVETGKRRRVSKKMARENIFPLKKKNMLCSWGRAWKMPASLVDPDKVIWTFSRLWAQRLCACLQLIDVLLSRGGSAQQ